MVVPAVNPWPPLAARLPRGPPGLLAALSLEPRRRGAGVATDDCGDMRHNGEYGAVPMLRSRFPNMPLEPARILRTARPEQKKGWRGAHCYRSAAPGIRRMAAPVDRRVRRRRCPGTSGAQGPASACSRLFLLPAHCPGLVLAHASRSRPRGRSAGSGRGSSDRAWPELQQPPCCRCRSRRLAVTTEAQLCWWRSVNGARPANSQSSIQLQAALLRPRRGQIQYRHVRGAIVVLPGAMQIVGNSSRSNFRFLSNCASSRGAGRPSGPQDTRLQLQLQAAGGCQEECAASGTDGAASAQRPDEKRPYAAARSRARLAQRQVEVGRMAPTRS